MKNSPWVPHWAHDFEVASHFEIPVIKPIELQIDPVGMVSHSRMKQHSQHGSLLLHGFLDDKALIRIHNRPDWYLKVAKDFAATVTPDFSMLTQMPQHQRLRSTIHSREVGAYLQSHGLNVLPNIRWAETSDLDFVLAGLGMNGAICISTQSLHRSYQLRRNLEAGIPRIIHELKPTAIIIYGPIHKELLNQIPASINVIKFPTDASAIYSRKAS